MNNPIKSALEHAVKDAAGQAAGGAISGALSELDNDTISLTVGPIVIPAFTVPVKIDTAKG